MRRLVVGPPKKSQDQVVDMAEAEQVAPSGDASSVEGGYHQELKRTLGSFQVFAISFAFISVAVGIFGTYDDVLQNSGPVGIWLWVLVAIGQLLIALVIAQFAARISLSGSSYQWASRLANPKIGWGFGWLTFCYLVLAVVAADFALSSQAFMPLFNIEPNEDTARMITVAILLIQVVLAIASTRIVSLINTAAVGVELTLVVVVAVALIIAVVITGDGSVDNLTSQGVAENAPNYFGIGGGLMLAMIMGLGTLVGFDAAANLAEEAKDPFRSVPRAIVGSVAAAGVLGLLLLIALTIAIRDIPGISASASPVADDHARPARPDHGTNTAGGRYVCLLRCRNGRDHGVLAHRLRDVARLALPRPPDHGTGQPPHPDTDPGDRPDPRSRSDSDDCAARRGIAGADHRGNNPPGAHLRVHDRSVPGGPRPIGSQEGRLRSGAVRAAGGNRCVAVVGVRLVRPGDAGVSPGTPHHRGRAARRRRVVLPLVADVPARSTRDRTRRAQRFSALRARRP